MGNTLKDCGASHQFGGDWTSAKLDVIAGYLAAYTTALKNAHFTTVYIDAFAGTGYREPSKGSMKDQGDLSEFPDLAEPEPRQLLKGSAQRALETVPRFDKYIFIERNAERCGQLRSLRDRFPELAEEVFIYPEDANEAIKKICEQRAYDWKSHRAVLFLDPYGMQVEWQTIEAIASTKAIDLWVLFPLGIGVNRILTRSGDIPPGWRNRLDLFLGSTDWQQALYQPEVIPADFFTDKQEKLVKATTDSIGNYFIQRLKTVFPAVIDRPGVLRNTRSCPLYLLCFAIGNHNPKAQKIALRIATHLLKGLL